MSDSISLAGSRTFDFIILGATGFTGAFVAKHLRRLSASKECNTIRWAVAGRSQAKLSELIKELSEIESTAPLPAILIVDIADQASLVSMFAAGSILLNCTGPYRFLGEAVVEACIQARTHYLDICGEPQFMETCFLKYNKLANDYGVLIIHACAFDSVPADLGVLFTMRQYQPNCCSSVESFLSIIAPDGIAGHYTTYECAVHGFGDASSLKKIRRDIEAKYKTKCRHVGPKLNKDRGNYFYEDRMASYAIPFMGADASVVRSSQRSLALQKSLDVWPQYAAYATINSGYNVAATAIYGGVFSALASFEFGRSVLLKYPEAFTNGIFSHKGPSAQQLASTRFEMHFFARGFSQPLTATAAAPAVAAAEASTSSTDPADQAAVAHTPSVTETCLSTWQGITRATSSVAVPSAAGVESADNWDNPDFNIHVVVSGAEPGYVATPTIFIALARCVLEERGRMCSGVLTPTAAFYDSNTVFDRLTQAGLEFKVIPSRPDPVV